VSRVLAAVRRSSRTWGTVRVGVASVPAQREPISHSIPRIAKLTSEFDLPGARDDTRTTMTVVRVTVLFVVLAALLLPAPAAARSSFCTGGDTCIAVTRRDGVVRLAIGTSPLAGRRYRLCVTAPDKSRTCRRFRLVVSGGGEIAGSSVRWSRHFPRKGAGKYVVRWALGGGSDFLPALDFRLRS